MTSRKIAIDCDPGWDDALALILLTADRSPNVIGISTVYGNGTLTNSTTNARHLTAFIDVPGLATYEGCSQRLPYSRHTLATPVCRQPEEGQRQGRPLLQAAARARAHRQDPAHPALARHRLRAQDHGHHHVPA